MESVRDQLIAHATKTIRKGGSSSLNFRSLGEAAGVKSSTVHYYFPTKGDLLEEISLNYGKNFLLALEQSSQRHKSAKTKILILVDLFMSAQASELSCLCGMLAVEHEQLDPKVRVSLNQFFQSLQNWVVTQLKEDKIDRPSGLPPAKFADILVSLLEGAILLGRLRSHETSLSNAKDWVQKTL